MGNFAANEGLSTFVIVSTESHYFQGSSYIIFSNSKEIGNWQAVQCVCDVLP